MRTRAEVEFNREMVTGTERLKREIGYPPNRFTQMIDKHGGPEAVRQLLRGRDASDGFTTLWEAGRLEMSVEAAALLPWYEELFTATERAVARRRLVEHGFDVAAFLRARTVSPPAWVSGEGST
jgi:hypothetical protein